MQPSPARSITKPPRARTLIEPLERRLLLTKFGVIGDFSAGTPLLQVSNMMKSWNPDYIMTLGDNSYSDDPSIDYTAGQYFHDYISPYTGAFGAGSTTGNKFFPILGNHDWDNSANASAYLNYFTLPGNERYYTITTGDVQWFMLDSDPREPDGVTADSVQGNWLRDQLAASTATYKLVLAHHPPYSSGEHTSITGMQWPFRQWGATAVIAGHDHNYERLVVNDLTYIVNGLGGESIRSTPVIVPGSQSRYTANDGAMLVESSPTSLNFKFYNRSNVLIDEYTIAAPGLNATIIPGGSTWKYLDNGTNQGSAWKNLGFVDTSWSTGTAQLGYGDGDEATVVSFGPNANNKYITTYFRKSFTVADPSAYRALSLQLLRDDGAVVYLNGTEVYRSNMPAGAIGHTTLAPGQIGGVDESTFFYAGINAALLTTGTNVLAVEVHQQAQSSSDLSFDARLVATLSAAPSAPAAPTGLAATSAGSSQINLTWTDVPGEQGYLIERAAGAGPFVHVATVNANATSYSNTGVAAGVVYTYRLRAWNEYAPSGYSATATATTPGVMVNYFGTGATWKYLDNGSNQGTAWRTRQFDDTLWHVGNSQLGYGEGDEATVVRYGLSPSHKYITTYFRKAFYVGNPSSIWSLTAELLRDDGAVVYINGVEAYRSNMPGGTIGHKTLASSAVNAEAETTYYAQSLSPSLLVAGINVIAVEIHQNLANSSDVSFDLRLKAVAAPPTSGPAAVSALMAAAVSANQINLSWIDTATSETGFRIQRSIDGVNFSQIAEIGPNQSSYADATVSPATTYWYRVYAFNTGGTSPSSRVASATTPASFTFAAGRIISFDSPKSKEDRFDVLI